MVTDSPVNERQRAELQELLSRFSNGYWQVEVAEADREKTAFTTVYTDASKDAVGAVLAQEGDGLEHVVAYASQALTHTQKRWSTFDHSPTVSGLEPLQVVIPSSLVPDLLQHLHGGPAAAHFSVDRVWEKARQSCYWPFMLGDIRQWCEQCRACQTRRSPIPKPMGVMQVCRPLQRVAADILELPVTSRGNRLHALEASERQKLYHDQTVCHRPYGVGALVWLNNPTESRTKLAPHWRGPYQVVQVFSSGGEPALTYDIINPLDTQERSQVVHHDRLKPYTLPLPARPPASRVVASDPFLHGGEASLEPALAQPQQSLSGL
uniref:Gypsy retrotransposon integrase-like protein 1 n=1 Tax=Knipowitschia caucasica TaxID=637954 RepID=A0AAV2MFI8_KNICA